MEPGALGANGPPTVEDPGLLNPPSHLHIAGVRNGIRVSWGAPAGGAKPTGDEVRYKRTISCSWSAGVSVTGRSDNITGLGDNEEYQVRVRATYPRGGTSGWIEPTVSTW